MDDIQGFALQLQRQDLRAKASTNRTATLAGGQGAIYGTNTALRRRHRHRHRLRAIGVAARPRHTAPQVTITGAANNGSGLIRITSSASTRSLPETAYPSATSARRDVRQQRLDDHARRHPLRPPGLHLRGRLLYRRPGHERGLIYGVFSYVQPTGYARALEPPPATATDGDDVLAATRLTTAARPRASTASTSAATPRAFPSSSEWTA